MLNLERDSLTKEIRLTDSGPDGAVHRCQVPSDLLSFSGTDDASESGERLSAVKRHVAGMLAILREAKQGGGDRREAARERSR